MMHGAYSIKHMARCQQHLQASLLITRCHNNITSYLIWIRLHFTSFSAHFLFFSNSELIPDRSSASRGPQYENRMYQITSPTPSRSLPFLPRSERSMSDTWQFISLYSLHCILTEVMLNIETSCHGNLVVHFSWMFFLFFPVSVPLSFLPCCIDCLSSYLNITLFNVHCRYPCSIVQSVISR